MIDNGRTTEERLQGSDALLVVRFALHGVLRFLSHAETLRVFQRACARADVPVKFSQGFNPHPRVSLPLPRPVGVEAEDECLVVHVFRESGWDRGDAADLQDRLAAQLPPDIVLRSAVLMKAGASIQPEAAEYVLPLTPQAVMDKGEQVRARAEAFLAQDHVVVERAAAEEAGKRRRGRRVDVRPFIKSIQEEENRVIVAYGVSNAGTIRVEEVLQLLEVTQADLAGPPQRRQPTWRIAN